jgi:hypothetical protein
MVNLLFFKQWEKEKENPAHAGFSFLASPLFAELAFPHHVERLNSHQFIHLS